MLLLHAVIYKNIIVRFVYSTQTYITLYIITVNIMIINLVKYIIAVKDCQTRWKSLRDRYKKEKDVVEAKKLRLPGTESKSMWRYFDQLEFLRDCCHDRRSVCKLI